MALVPSSQFHATTSYDSFQSSFSSFHGTRLQFFRYRPSVSLKKHIFYATQNTLFSDSFPQQNPARKSKFGSPSKSISLHWIDKWSHVYQENSQKQSVIVFNYRSSESGSVSNIGISKSDDGENSTTMDKIVERLRKFRSVDDGDGKKGKGPERVIEEVSVEEGMLPGSRDGLSDEPPLRVKSVFSSGGEIRFPWEKPIEKERRESGSVRMKSKTSVAELTLPASELRRLRKLALETQSKIKIGGAGVTQPVVEKIREMWKTSEIVRLRVEGAAALNMKKMHDMLERRTGGLVIWRSGTAISLYRGVSYEVPFVQMDRRGYRRNEVSVNSLPATTTDKTVESPENAFHTDMGAPQANSETNPEDKGDIELVPEVKYEDEVDKLLDSLGPRYTDWQGCNPLPVDADMLPGFVPGYRPPYRILPYGTRPSIGLKEGTSLRRLGKILPPHFALGRSRQLQGLAVAMIKLWERSSIAKIALKRGVQLTTSERMAEDLKRLTGGTLLSRSKDFLVFYRGKDFLSPDVTEALLEKERLAKALQDEEEQARLRVSTFVLPTAERENKSGIAGTLGETLDADARWGKKFSGHHKEKIIREGETLRHARVVKKLENKLAFAERKLRKAEAALCKVEAFLKPSDRQADPNSITDEERFMFRKLGLKMKAFLLLGRRGVFDGTVENMHLHWKYRELVKIIVNAKTFDQVKKVALALEAESGGVLVSVDKMSKGYAVIVFRGKDYQRPSTLRPKNLLTKRKALARSIELQRREALLNHISAVQIRVEKLRSELEQMETVKDQGDEKLYETLESAYVSDDDNSEEEGNEAYLGMYNDGTNGEYETDSDPEDLTYDFQDQVSETEPEPHEHAVITASFTGTNSDPEPLPYDFQDQVSKTEPEPHEHAVISAPLTGTDEVEKQETGMF